MNYISLKNLSLGYGSRKIIHNISIDINKGEYIYIIGENGVGKSTLIKGLTGSLKPLSGKIVFNKNIKNSDIGYLPQISTSIQNFPASVNEIVLTGCLNNELFSFKYKSDKQQLVNKILGNLNILDLKNKSFKELSGGQQRRVLLARAMVSSKKILILDEPIAGLDPKAAKIFYDFLKEININYNLTIIIVSHDMKAASNYADKVLHLHDEGYCYGNVEEYKKNMISEYFMSEDI